MKRLSLLVTLLVVLGLLLAACGAEELGETATPGLELTEEVVPGTPETEVATEAPLVVTGTPEVVETETPAVVETETPVVEETGTPVLPETGAQDQPWRLSQLLQFRALDQNCDPVGQVEGLAFDAVSGDLHYLVVRTEIAPLEAGTPTPTIAVTGTVTATETVTETEVADLVFVPWSATDLFDPAAAGEQPAGTPAVEASPVVTGTLTATPTGAATPTAAAAQTATATPSGATPAPALAPGEELCPGEDQAVALLVAQDAVAGAPAFAETPDVTAADWDADIVAYWTGQLETPPATVSNPALIESLSRILLHGEGGENFGPVVEVILATGPGQISHVVFSPGGLLNFNDRLIPLPWAAVEFDPALNLFVLTANADESDLEQAPNFPSVQDLPDPTADPDWDQEIQAYWSELTT